MSAAGRFLRRTENGFSHWCPACGGAHHIWVPGWDFNNDLDKPSFNPSIKVTGKQTVMVDGRWAGEWVRGPDGRALDLCCHYFLREGRIFYENDCTHALRGQAVDLPPWPAHIGDDPSC